MEGWSILSSSFSVYLLLEVSIALFDILLYFFKNQINYNSTYIYSL